jgi:hypothetical protein
MSSYIHRLHLRMGLLLVLLTLVATASAQPARADQIFAEAKTMIAAADSVEAFERAFQKFDEASSLFRVAKAIRLVQKAMIDGRIKASGTSTGCRAETFASGPKKDEFKCDPNAPYSHPYFWSPFVLIGNWR